MNVNSTLIANLPEAGLAVVAGGNDWIAYAGCMAVAAFVDAFFPGLGSLIALSCYVPAL